MSTGRYFLHSVWPEYCEQHRPTRRDRNQVIKAFSLGIVVGSFLTAGIVFGTTQAKADGILDASELDYVVSFHDAVCEVVDQYHSASGVFGVAEAIVKDGFSPDSAVDIINASVSEYCPRNWPLLVAIGEAARGSTT